MVTPTHFLLIFFPNPSGSLIRRVKIIIIIITRSQQLARCNPLFHFLNVLVPTGFVLVGQKNNNDLIACSFSVADVQLLAKEPTSLSRSDGKQNGKMIFFWDVTKSAR